MMAPTTRRTRRNHDGVDFLVLDTKGCAVPYAPEKNFSDMPLATPGLDDGVQGGTAELHTTKSRPIFSSILSAIDRLLRFVFFSSPWCALLCVFAILFAILTVMVFNLITSFKGYNQLISRQADLSSQLDHAIKNLDHVEELVAEVNTILKPQQ